MSEFKLLIGGKLVDGAKSSPVLNPATEESVADCPRGSEGQLNEAVAAAIGRWLVHAGRYYR